MAFKDSFKKTFDTISNAVEAAARTTADQAKVVAEIAKLNVKIAAEENKIKNAEQALGKQYYNDFEAGIPVDSESYLPLCDEIKASKALIAEYRDTIEELKKKPEAADAAENAAAEAEAVADEVAEDVAAQQEDAAEKIEFTVVDDDKPAEE